MDWVAEAAQIRKDRGLGNYQPLQPFVSHRTVDRSLWYEGQLIVTYAHGKEVDHTCCVWEGNCPEGMGPPPHIHLYDHEFFFIVDGRLRAWVEGTEFDVPKDSMIFLPAGRTHWFLSAAPVTRIFSFTVTASKEFPSFNGNNKLFEFLGRPAEEVAMPPTQPGAEDRPDPAALMKLCEETGSVIIDLERLGWRRKFGDPNG
jgi:mannose-6-phosphate isomerase-like protein (cupin superfamily)